MEMTETDVPNSSISSTNGYLAECDSAAIYYLTKAPEGDLYVNYVVIVAVNIILSLVGGVANLLVILAYFKIIRRQARYEFNTTLLAFLAAADLLTTAIVQPLVVSRTVIELFNERSCTYWLVIRRLYEFTVPVSFLTVGLITYERYQALFYPIRYRSAPLRRRIKRAMVGVWVFALITTSLRTFKFFAMVYYALALLIIVVLVVANTIIYLKIGRMAATFTRNRGSGSTTSGGSRNKESRKSLARDKRSTRTLFYIFLSLFLCYLPMVGAILYSLIKGEQTIGFLFGYLPWADTFAFLNSTLDPFIYCLRNPRLKGAVLDLLCRDHRQRKRDSQCCNEAKNSLMMNESGSGQKNGSKNS